MGPSEAVRVLRERLDYLLQRARASSPAAKVFLQKEINATTLAIAALCPLRGTEALREVRRAASKETSNV